MNKFKLIIFIFSFIIIFFIVGSLFVQADTEIKEEQDILEQQNKITDNINIYEYNIENPYIVINPYNKNYNSALIVFETEEYISIKVNINDTNTFNTNKTNKHYIGVYGLNIGKNTITMSYKDKKKKIEIEIKEGEETIKLEDTILLSNNHVIEPTYKYLENNNYTGLREVDILGKIYYEYLLDDGYKGLACEIDEEKLAVLSDNLLILDRQNGNIIDSIDISNYDTKWLKIYYKENKINLYSKEFSISIDENKNIVKTEDIYKSEPFSGDINYQHKQGIRFYKKTETKQSDKNILLIKYKKREDNEIKIKKEYNRLVVTNENKNDCNTYIILEKTFDKKIYELCNKTNYIYTYDFKGKYSVYFKKNEVLYKTNEYIIF